MSFENAIKFISKRFFKKKLYLYLIGRVIAELKVDGVKSSYTKRPYDMCLSLLVYNISLVDRVQTYGPEFAMLLSSHNTNRGNGHENITPGRKSLIKLGN